MDIQAYEKFIWGWTTLGVAFVTLSMQMIESLRRSYFDLHQQMGTSDISEKELIMSRLNNIESKIIIMRITEISGVFYFLNIAILCVRAIFDTELGEESVIMLLSISKYLLVIPTLFISFSYIFHRLAVRRQTNSVHLI